MKTIETVLAVDEHGMATVRMPPDVTPGEQKVLIVIETTPSRKAPLTFSSHDVGPWPFGPEETFRREDMYDEDGR
jgi:hypothetical protein